MYNHETEIRHVDAVGMMELGRILSNAWKDLMMLIPKDTSADVSDSNYELKYRHDHICSIEEYSNKCHTRTAAEILFEEWGTSGRKRPTLGILLKLLIKAQQFRAADYVAVSLLNEPPPKRPDRGPAAKIPMNFTASSELHDLERRLDKFSDMGTNTLNDNASLPTVNNNKNFFDKFLRSHKNIDIEKSDLIKFSANSVTANEVNNRDPKSSEGDVIDDTENAYQHDSLSLANIPDFSALNTQSSSEIMPDISLLNYHGDEETNSSRPEQLSNASSVSSSSNNDDGFMPNLSMLDQRSSSLTNITETSGENSFDMSNDSSKDNVI